ncbi:zona occludens toxin [Plasticicumulans lactativorans]|uniref:Zona occludens toxin n=1 Tax=Plasticicumulans lactativorans TaxID=1133106 RepID=A0A4R2L3K9_9GAMM|nr:zonular occludens toxin domain-containing protein [Plasticicumulans lactativorans]TCO81104.1 zona occludens toxin [Plasticicumulans lactativorans]
MSIVSFCGKPRSGKSYSCIEHVLLPALEKGRSVWCNIPLMMDVIRSRFPTASVSWFDAGEWLRDPESIEQVEPGSILIIDECWRLFPSGQKSNVAPMAFRSFLAEHGHRTAGDWTTEVVLICQDLSQIAGWVRVLVERTYVTTKLSALGTPDRFRLEVFSGPVGVDRAPKRQLVQSYFKKYDSAVYQYYKSQTKGEGHGKEELQGVKASIWRRPIFWLVIPAALVGAVWASLNLRHFFKGGAVEGVPQPVAAAPVQHLAAQPLAAVPVSVPVLAPARKEASPALSTRWRIAGIFGPHDEQVILYDGRYTRVLDRLRDCTQNGYGETRCIVEGELITHYSGRDEQSIPEAPDFGKLNPSRGDAKESKAGADRPSRVGSPPAALDRHSQQLDRPRVVLPNQG